MRGRGRCCCNSFKAGDEHGLAAKQAAVRALASTQPGIRAMIDLARRGAVSPRVEGDGRGRHQPYHERHVAEGSGGVVSHAAAEGNG